MILHKPWGQIEFLSFGGLHRFFRRVHQKAAFFVLSEEEFDTIGGLVTNAFGHLPQRDEQVTIDQFRFKVLNADGRRVHLMELQIVD